MNEGNMTTTATHDLEDGSWIIVPIVLGLLIYMSLALFVWPYARPVFSIWVIFFCLLFPPAFFFLSTYIVFLVCFGSLSRAAPPAEARVIVVDRVADVSVVEQRGRVRPAGTSRSSSRV